MTRSVPEKRPNGVNLRLGVGVFAAWLVGMSVVSGTALAIQLGNALGEFGAVNMVGAIASIRVLRERAASIAATAVCLGYIAALHGRPGLPWQRWSLAAAVPGTALSAFVAIPVAVAVLVTAYAASLEATLANIEAYVEVDDVLVGLGLAAVFSLILVVAAPVLVRLAPDWSLGRRLALAWLVVNLAKAAVLITLWIVSPATSEPALPGAPGGVELLQ